MREQILRVMACIICGGLLLWGIQHLMAPEKIVRRKFPDAQTFPKQMLRNTKMKGLTMACVGGAGLVYALFTLLGIG